MALAGGIGRAWEHLRGLPDRTPLRVKLITAVLALVAIALAVISIVGISALTRDLLGQADTQIETLYAQAQTGRHLYSSVIGPEPWVYEGLTSNGPPTFVGGNVQSNTLPDLSSGSIAWLTTNPGRPMTVPGGSGSSWRVAAHPGFPFIQTSNGTQVTGTLFVGLDVSGAYRTIGQLVATDLIVSALLLLLLLVVGIAVVRASLRPLTGIEKTAEAIAAGDLTRRVPEGDPRTEMGRLGGSLNAMLAQIETAFDDRAQSELAARKSEERMRQFVADASHELRTPLTAIRASAEYYRQRGGLEEVSGGRPARQTLGNGVSSGATAARRADADPAGPGAGPLARPELDRIMQRVEQESSRMGVLVEDMLLLARLDQQRPLERHTVDMLTLAADAVHDARLVAPDRSIELTVGAGSALLVMGDEVRLRQVIGNLMSNALTHTPDGTPIKVGVRSGSLDEWQTATASAGRTVIAAAGADGQPSPAVIFEVADQGPGLTPYQAEHVFERFFRVDQARTRKSGGTGLGLAIVSALAAAHGGTVWVESPPGGGATFRVAIPLAPEARSIEPEPADGTDPDVIGQHRALGPEPGPGIGTQPGPGIGTQPGPGIGAQF